MAGEPMMAAELDFSINLRRGRLQESFKRNSIPPPEGPSKITVYIYLDILF